LRWAAPIMSTFRDATAAVTAEAEILAARHLDSLPTIPTGHRSVFVRRTARIAAGVVGTLVAAAIVYLLAHRGAMKDAYGAAAVRLLLWSWPAMAAAYVVAAVASGVVLRRRLRRHVARTADPFRDAAALRQLDLAAVERAMSSRFGPASYAWPLLAITLLAPHTLQLPFVVPERHPVEFAAMWMRVTGVLSIHIYLYGVLAAWTFPENGHVWQHIGWTIFLSLFPGVLTFGLASAIVLATATAVAVLGYWPMRALMRREDAALSTTWTARAAA
jgi:hypothetical protein